MDTVLLQHENKEIKIPMPGRFTPLMLKGAVPVRKLSTASTESKTGYINLPSTNTKFLRINLNDILQSHPRYCTKTYAKRYSNQTLSNLYPIAAL